MSCGDPDDVHCREALDQLYAVIDSELAAGDMAAIKQHIDDCAPCLSEYDLEVIIKKLVARSCAEQAPVPLRERVLTTIRSVQVDYAVSRSPGEQHRM